MAPTDTTVERLGADVPTAALDALVAEAGWNQTADDWRVFLDRGTVFGLREAGRIVATAAVLPYDARFAWISMVLVAATHRRAGLGTLLLRHCIAEAESAGRVPMLDATPAGRAVYLQLGFHDLWSFERLQGAGGRGMAEISAPAGVRIAPITDDDFPKVCAYDCAAFGADRTALLDNLRRRVPQAAFAAWVGDAVAGFVLARDGRRATQVGPVIAEDSEIAQALLGRALAQIDGPAFTDVAIAEELVCAMLTERGFTHQRPFTRMRQGRGSGFDDPSRTFAVVGPEFG